MSVTLPYLLLSITSHLFSPLNRHHFVLCCVVLCLLRTGGSKRARGVRAVRAYACGVPGHEPSSLDFGLKYFCVVRLAAIDVSSHGLLKALIRCLLVAHVNRDTLEVLTRFL